MDWWVWIVIALALLAVLAGSFLAVQARRRGGGVIVAGKRPRGGKGSGP
ncbi:hypothetical protein EES41_06960 [Streptomyces sp. ADI95-16]|nr:hypothetical protein EES41_06960 [Streptomyces sp. ADI95-16]